MSPIGTTVFGTDVWGATSAVIQSYSDSSKRIESSVVQFSFDQPLAQFTMAAGALKTNTAINYEAKELVNFGYTTTIVVTAGTFTDTCPVTISVLDQNDLPVFVNSARSVPENSGYLQPVGSPLVATDEDLGQVMFSILCELC
jgi:hypothetical protein